MAIAVATVGCQRQPAPTTESLNPTLKTEQQFRDKVAELRMQREKTARAIERLEKKKAETVAYLKEKGVQSSADISQDTDLKYAARNLKGWKEEIDKFQQELGFYDEAIAAIQAMLSEIERKNISESTAMSEQDLLNLRKIVLDLNDRLDVDKPDLLEDEEMDQLLRDELGSSKSEPRK